MTDITPDPVVALRKRHLDLNNATNRFAGLAETLSNVRDVDALFE
jgi:hypothetical protein